MNDQTRLDRTMYDPMYAIEIQHSSRAGIACIKSDVIESGGWWGCSPV